MNVLAIHRAASGVAEARPSATRAAESYAAVAAKAAQAQAIAAGTAQVSHAASPAAVGIVTPLPKPELPWAKAPVEPPRPRGVPADYVYRPAIEMWLPPAAAAIYDAQVVDAQQQAAQLEFWQTCTDPTRIEGYPLERWSTEQLQAGLAYYSSLLDQAVPKSNEWLALKDRVNSIQANLDGNRIPWTYTLSEAVDYGSPISSR